MREPTVEDILDWMEPEMRVRWDQAIEERGSTFDNFGAPDCGCDGYFVPYFCDSCDTWHESWKGVCWDVDEGVVYMFEWTCDEEGDWDYDTVAPVGEVPENYHKALLELSFQRTDEYYEWKEEHDEED